MNCASGGSTPVPGRSGISVRAASAPGSVVHAQLEATFLLRVGIGVRRVIVEDHAFDVGGLGEDNRPAQRCLTRGAMRRSLLFAITLVSCSPAAPEPHIQPATVVSVPPSAPRNVEASEPSGDVEEEPTTPAPSPAQPPMSANSRAQAQSAFEQARRAFLEGRYAEACALFDESIQHEPSVGSYLNLGRCRESEGNVPAACQAYGEVLRMSPTGDRANYTVAAMQKLGCSPP